MEAKTRGRLSAAGRSKAPARGGPRPARSTPSGGGAAEGRPGVAGRPGSDEGLVRVSKLMSERGLCSRREADQYIERGWVLVDGRPVTELGTRAHPSAEIRLARPAQTRQGAQVTILLNKPVGYVSGQAEQGYKPAVTLVTAAARHPGDKSPQRFNPAHLKGLAPAGRLPIT